MGNVVKLLGLCLLGLGAFIGLGLLLSFPVMWLWNWLMPHLFGLPRIGVLEAWGLQALCGILFQLHLGTAK